MAEKAPKTHHRKTIPTYTPTMLATFERCPRQYLLRYMHKRRSAEGPLNCGSATHNVLRQLFDHYRRLHVFPLDWRKRVDAQFPVEDYQNAEARTADVERVIDWVEWTLTSFDGSARIVAVERTYEYLFPGSRDGLISTFRLRHTVDLVLEHKDGAIEHVDWKTGNGYSIDPIHNIVARIVIGQSFPHQPCILSSTNFLSAQKTRMDELSYEAVKAVWEQIKGLTQAIKVEQDWLPVSNPLCPWCPFYKANCPLYPLFDAPDTMTSWLEEGVA